jgi:L-lactate dehydrogenase complex protein LldF
MIQSSHDHAPKAAQFVKNIDRARWHDSALWFVRAKRDKAAQSLPEWETLRERAAAIKMHTVTHLADYLEQFAEQAERRGVHVHWAPDAETHNRIVLELLQRHQVKRVVKSKSMLTEECHLNPHLEKHGIEVIDTDLGERIVQLRNEPPSHIVLPAIHIKKEEVGELFHEHLGTEAGASDPDYLTEAARGHLREMFLSADAGITGINFAIAETGGFVVCTNEGNADLGASLPKLHIACMGIEKLIPRAADLGVFLRLLARSATGQPITTYSSHFHGPAPGGELHVILVDNGRSAILASDDFRRSLSCIRCGACMNTCPVYRRSGGHSYGTTVPGPIGSILAPVRDGHHHHSLPFACSLCGSCTDVCPVKIDLHHQLLTLRREMNRGGHLPWTKRLSMKVAAWVMSSERRLGLLGRLARVALRWTPRFLVYQPANTWGKQRELPIVPLESFRDAYRHRQKVQAEQGGDASLPPPTSPVTNRREGAEGTDGANKTQHEANV